MPDEKQEAIRRPQVLQAGGSITREIDPATARTIKAKFLTPERDLDVDLPVPPEFLHELSSIGKTAEGIVIIDRTASLKKEELVSMTRDLPSDGHFELFERRFSIVGLDKVLIGEPALNRFRVSRIDPRTRQELIDYYLPLIDVNPDNKGEVILMRVDLETKGWLQDIALKRAGEKATSTESRLDLPSSITLRPENKNIPGINHPILVESGTGALSHAGRLVTVECASTVGPREGVDEDLVFLHQYKIPGIGEVMVASVKDGMGGAQAGEVASQLAAKVEKEFLSGLENRQSLKHIEISTLAKERYGGDKRMALIDLAVQAQNQAVFKERSNRGTDMGSTTTEFFVFPDAILVAHVGDTRAYVDGGQGLRRATVDHGLVDQQVTAGLISPGEALTSPEKNLIYKALGDKPTIKPNIDKYSFPPRRLTLVIACDGFTATDTSGGKINNGTPKDWREWISPEVQQALATPGNPNATVCHAVKAAMENGVRDNTSYIKITIEPIKKT